MIASLDFFDRKRVLVKVLFVLMLIFPSATKAESGEETGHTQSSTHAEASEDISVAALEETVVVSSRVAEQPSYPTVSASVLTAEHIKALSAQNLGEALRFLPGISVTRGTRRNRIRVSIRGFNPRYVKIYLDGVPINPASDEAVDLSTIPLENIERVEVIKGPAPVKYGANAMAGVILITTKSGDKYPGVAPFYTHTFSPAADEVQEVEEGAVVTVEDTKDLYQGDRFGLTIGGGSPELNAYAMAVRDTSEGFRPHSAYEQNNFGGRILWKPLSGMNLDLTGGYFSGDRELLNRTVILERSGQYGGGGSGTGPMYGAADWELNDWSKAHAALDTEASLSRWAQLHGTVYFFRESFQLNVQKPSDQEGSRSESPRESLVAGGEIQQDFRVSHRLPFQFEHLITLGFSGQYESFTWGNSANPVRDQTLEEQDASALTLGVYLQDSMKILNDLRIVLGIRHDLQTENQVSLEELQESSPPNRQATSPHLSVLYGWKDRILLHGAVGRTYRFPRLRDLYDYTAGNPDLDPESAWDFELGVNAEVLPFMVVKVSAFRNEVEDLIYSPGKFIQFQNIGEVRFQGVEAEWIAEPVPGAGLFVNYTYMDGWDLESDERAPYSPEHKLSYGATLSRWKCRLSYQGVFVSERATGDALTPRLPAYHVADLKLARDFGLSGISPGSVFEVFGAIQNLFDEGYEEILGFPMPGRTFLLGGSVRWAW